MELLGLFFLPIFGFGFVMYFVPFIIALAKSKTEHPDDFSHQLLSWVEFNRVGGRAGDGFAERRAAGAGVGAEFLR